MSRLITLSAAIALSALLADTLHASRPMADRQTDSLVNHTKIIHIDGRPAPDEAESYNDSIRQRIASFYYDQFRHISDPATPYFLFMSKDARLAMGIGGCVRMRAYYDWDGAIPASGFAPMLIPMTPDPTDMRHLGTTPAGTALFFRVLGRNKAIGEYQLYIECNFDGYQSRDFHLKKAYAMINDFTVGYTSSTFSDPAALPPTVDAQGPNNKIAPTSVLIRYMPTFRERWSIGVSAETPATSISVDNVHTKAVSNWMPDFAVLAQYQWAQGQHIRLSGIVRTLSYRDLAAGKNRNKIGWGLQISSVARATERLTCYATGSYGHGYASLGGDLMIGNYDLVSVSDNPTELYAPASFGWCVGLQYHFRPDLFISASASQNRYLPARAVDGSEYKWGIFSAVNVFWNMTPRIQFGAEFDLGWRHNFNGAQRSAKRVGAMCQFSF